MSEIRRLYRSNRDTMLGGVCGGLAEYLRGEPTIVRLATVVLTLSFPPLFLVYLLAWIIVPRGPEEVGVAGAASAAEPAESASETGEGRSPELLAGFVLVALGLFLLAERLGFFDLWVFRWITWGNLWPLALVGLGVYLVVRGFSSSASRAVDQPPGAPPPAENRPPSV